MPKIPDFLLEAAKDKKLTQDSPSLRKEDEKKALQNLYSSADAAIQEVSLRNKSLQKAAQMHTQAAQIFADKAHQFDSHSHIPFHSPEAMTTPNTQPSDMPPTSAPVDMGGSVTGTPYDMAPGGSGVSADHTNPPVPRHGMYNDGDMSYPITTPQLNDVSPIKPIPPGPPGHYEDKPDGVNTPGSPTNIANQGDPQAEIMAIAQATGMSPQKVAALALLGEQASKLQQQQSLPQPLAGV